MSNNIREIYTKAIVAKGKKLSKCTYSFVINDNPNEILGCWITNHRFEAIIKNRIPKVIGSLSSISERVPKREGCMGKIPGSGS
jgi:spore coat protein E